VAEQLLKETKNLETTKYSKHVQLNWRSISLQFYSGTL